MRRLHLQSKFTHLLLLLLATITRIKANNFYNISIIDEQLPACKAALHTHDGRKWIDLTSVSALIDGQPR